MSTDHGLVHTSLPRCWPALLAFHGDVSRETVHYGRRKACMIAESMNDLLEMIRCGVCSAMNRVPLEKVQTGRRPICGNCRSPLALRLHPLVVTDSTFAEHVERSRLPVLLDLWAPWCGPCRLLTPVVEELAGELAGRLRVASLNVDENPVTASRFRIQSIPALLLFQNGVEIDRIVGAQPKPEILRHLLRVIPG